MSEPSAPPVDAATCAAFVIETLPAVMHALRTRMRGQLAGGLSVPQFRCLNFIEREGTASVGEVARFLGVTMATASANVDRLARAGHLSAAPAEQDRRRSVLSLTPQGRQLVADVRRGAQREIEQALAGCSAPELAAVRDGLQTLAGRLLGSSTD